MEILYGRMFNSAKPKVTTSVEIAVREGAREVAMTYRHEGPGRGRWVAHEMYDGYYMSEDIDGDDGEPVSRERAEAECAARGETLPTVEEIEAITRSTLAAAPPDVDLGF